ncbi:MAG: SLBB domain-containing protein [Thermodesulfovibrionia bacterium]|nr:SLBB domain-containing protein [Thermodesulfovibrionia bacterium]
MKYLLVFSLAVFNIFFFTASLSAKETRSLGEYKVGLSDVISIDVINEPGLKTTTIISVDGTITFPYLGTIYVKGMSIPAIEKKIAEGLGKGYIKYPVVSVSLISSLSRKYFIYGEVRESGGFPFEDGMTVVKAISRTGGITNDGIYGKIKVRRKQDDGIKYKDIEIDLKGTIEGSKTTGDMLIEPDDIIIVERNKTYFVHGEVDKPGEYVLGKEITILNAITIAGGISNDGLYGDVKLRRKQHEGGYKDIEINLIDNSVGSSSGHTMLQPEDTVIVERNKTFFVNGEVTRAGEYVLETGMTVLQAISVVGGVREQGLYGKVMVRHKQDGDGGAEDIAIDLNGVPGAKATGNLLLQPGDTLIVERDETYFVHGEVNKPGEYILKDNMTAFKAIILAGGFTKWGSPTRVKVLRHKENEAGYISLEINIEKVISGDATSDIDLQPGDILVAYAGIF